MEILKNPDNLKECKNFKEAICKILAAKHYSGIISIFIKYLFDK